MTVQGYQDPAVSGRVSSGTTGCSPNPPTVLRPPAALAECNPAKFMSELLAEVGNLLQELVHGGIVLFGPRPSDARPFFIQEAGEDQVNALLNASLVEWLTRQRDEIFGDLSP